MITRQVLDAEEREDAVQWGRTVCGSEVRRAAVGINNLYTVYRPIYIYRPWRTERFTYTQYRCIIIVTYKCSLRMSQSSRFRDRTSSTSPSPSNKNQKTCSALLNHWWWKSLYSCTGGWWNLVNRSCVASCVCGKIAAAPDLIYASQHYIATALDHPVLCCVGQQH